MKASCCIFFFLLLQAAGAQTARITQLQQHIHTATSPQQQLDAIIALGDEYPNLNRDTLDRYAYQGWELAAHTTGTTKAKAAYLLAADYYRWGWIDSLHVLTDSILPLVKPADPAARDTYFKLARLKAFGYAGRSRYEEALQLFYSIINDAEKYRDTLHLALNMNSIGSVALLRSIPADGLTWARKALATCGQQPRFDGIRSAAFSNMATAFNMMGSTDSASLYINRSIAIARQNDLLYILATALRIKSQVDINGKRFAEAENALLEMFDVRRKTHDEKQFTDDGLQLGEFYYQTQQYNKAIAFCRQALVPGSKYSPAGNAFISSVNLRKDYYELLARCYKATGQTQLYTQTLEQLVAAKDSFYQDNSATAMAEMEVKYKSGKQQLQIKELENDKLKQQAEKQALFRNFLIGFILLILMITAYVLYTNRRLKQQNEHLSRKNREIEEAHMKGQHVERKRVAGELHDNLNTKLAALRWRLEALDTSAYPEADQKMLRGLVEVLDDIYADVRLISHNMLPVELETLGLAAAVQKLVRQLNTNPKTYFNLLIGEPLQRLHPQAEFELYNVLLELVNNIIKHARAGKVWISLSAHSTSMVLTVSDNGIGFDTAVKDGDGIGLRNIQARVAGLKGQLAVTSTPGNGATFTIKIPA